ncbi:hypothetical protein SAMN05660484_02166 [Eubacterium ruminantium]|uniref:Uncharacterized protein n=1 Tax=Eubacterium ruminantium TaxID=42322 RepID=A0A1T4QQP9_9FIRM|nr:hypothetical protein [Eubacterium ruminantium]SCW63343.1 hypothetical protein SAMN05660484_02166 [Eubacterium ruminantium]SDN45406.1 hypothetical protein SAMN04490370_12532 [Eubacterium ruminantium]SKA05996.1 hypothetical protein SAMN02745110_02473 [Eubacterium ruminantium]
MANIELVIKIPEDEYRWIVKSDETVFANISSKECMLHAIKNGTPLPKGHGNLIDANELLKEKIRFEDFDGDTFNIIHEETVINAKTIIKADTESEEV